MKVVVVGTRGFPDVAGGVETHCCELYPRLAALGVDVTVMRRRRYVSPVREYLGVKFRDIYSPGGKYFETLLHTFAAVVMARSMKPDILHVHAIGPSLVVPFAKLLGLKVVMTHHGADYKRGKWGHVASMILRLGESLGIRQSNAVIAVSEDIRGAVLRKKPDVDCRLIHNGVNPVERTSGYSYVRSLGLEPGKYVVAMGRFVKEKGFDHLIDAFLQASPQGYKLVIAGDSDFHDAYSRRLKAKAGAASVVLTGYIKGQPQCQLMSHAALFVMPSFHEGLPIALLEALSYRLDVIVSDIEANRLGCLDSADFYPVGDTESLARKLQEKLRCPMPRTYDLTAYDWDRIAAMTLQVYQSVLDK